MAYPALIALYLYIALLFLITSVHQLRGRKSIVSWVRKKGREEYDEAALCHFEGKLSTICAIGAMFAAASTAFAVNFLASLGILTLGLAAMFAHRYMLDYGSSFEKGRFCELDEEQTAEITQRRHKQRIFYHSVAGITLTAVVSLFIYAERDPQVEITYLYHDMGVRVRGLHGTSVSFSQINDITIIEDSMNNLRYCPVGSGGWRRNGESYVTFGAMKGWFESGLLYVQPRQAPTLRIDYNLRVSDQLTPHSIYISFRNPETTRQLYVDLVEAVLEVQTTP